MTVIFNRTYAKEKRRKLRNNMTYAEKLIWEKLRRRQIKNKRFLRQFGIGKYVVDFYCPEIKLAVEVDGTTHNSIEEIEYDTIRQFDIEDFGIRFFRVTNEEVFKNIDQVIINIETLVDTTPLNPPFCKGGK